MRKYITSSFSYLAIGFLPLASNFLLTPFFTRYLSPEEYGILALAALLQAYLTILISSGFDSAFSRLFYQYYRKPKLLNDFFSTILFCVALISGLYSLLLFVVGEPLLSWVFSNDSFTFSQYGSLVLLTTVMALLHSISLAYYRNLENIEGFAWLAVAYFLLMTLGSVLGVMVFKLGAWGSLAGKALGAAVVMVLFLLYFFSKHALVFRKSFLKPAAKYGLPVVPYLILGISLDNLDRLMIERFVSLADLGRYNIAFLIASVLAVMLQSLASAINPAVFRLLEQTDTSSEDARTKEINLLFSGINLFTLLCVAALMAVCVPVVHFLLDAKYHSLLAYLPLLFLAYVPRVYFIIYSLPLFYHHKTKLLPVINFIALLAGGTLMFLLLKLWGIVGICLGVVAIKAIQACLALHYVKTEGFYVSKMFALHRNHLLSILLCVIIPGAVAAANRFECYRALIFTASGMFLLIVSLAIFRQEVKQLHTKLMVGMS